MTYQNRTFLYYDHKALLPEFLVKHVDQMPLNPKEEAEFREFNQRIAPLLDGIDDPKDPQAKEVLLAILPVKG